MALTWLIANSVLAAPVPDIRKARRETPRRRAWVWAQSSARRLAARLRGSRGRGANSPLDVASILIGSRTPSAS